LRYEMLTLMARARVPWEFDATANAASAREKIAPPWTVPALLR